MAEGASSGDAHTARRGHGATLVLGAVGVVYGDIGTSPLYTMREVFGGHHPLAFTPENVYGLLSVIFWALVVVVTLKYVVLIMRADNRGEGGILALTALVSRGTENQARLRWWLVGLGIFGSAMFFGDAMITPAISVLSAVEGLEVITPLLHPFIVPVTLVILIALFSIQKRGTGSVGVLFGPICLVWFVVIAALGVAQIIENPAVLKALSPHYAAVFVADNPVAAFLALGAVVLAVTGTEALYADMGHFGASPIRRAWLLFVMPALVLNYFGQGALLLANPAAIKNPFYLLAPQWGLLPLVILATCATVIASQAVISGAFSLDAAGDPDGLLPTHQDPAHLAPGDRADLRAVHQLDAADRGDPAGARIPQLQQPRGRLRHRRDDDDADRLDPDLLRDAPGVGLVAGHCAGDRRSARADRLRVPRLELAQDSRRRLVPAADRRRGVHAADDLEARAAGADGAPGRGFDPVGPVHREHRCEPPPRVAGTAVFMASTPGRVPHALLHNLKHNKVLHERVVFLTVRTRDIPVVSPAERVEILELGSTFWQIHASFGFKEDPDVPSLLDACGRRGFGFDMMDTSFFVSRETLIATVTPGMALWRERLFVSMSRNAVKATDFFRIPTNRVVELGTQVEL